MSGLKKNKNSINTVKSQFHPAPGQKGPTTMMTDATKDEQGVYESPLHTVLWGEGRQKESIVEKYAIVPAR